MLSRSWSRLAVALVGAASLLAASSMAAATAANSDQITGFVIGYGPGGTAFAGQATGLEPGTWTANVNVTGDALVGPAASTLQVTGGSFTLQTAVGALTGQMGPAAFTLAPTAAAGSPAASGPSACVNQPTTSIFAPIGCRSTSATAGVGTSSSSATGSSTSATSNTAVCTPNPTSIFAPVSCPSAPPAASTTGGTTAGGTLGVSAADLLPTTAAGAARALQLLSAAWYAATGQATDQTALHTQAAAIRLAYPQAGPTGGYTVEQVGTDLPPPDLTDPTCPDSVYTPGPLTVTFAGAVSAKFTGELIDYRIQAKAGCATVGAVLQGTLLLP